MLFGPAVAPGTARGNRVSSTKVCKTEGRHIPKERMAAGAETLQARPFEAVIALHVCRRCLSRDSGIREDPLIARMGGTKRTSGRGPSEGVKSHGRRFTAHALRRLRGQYPWDGLGAVPRRPFRPASQLSRRALRPAGRLAACSLRILADVLNGGQPTPSSEAKPPKNSRLPLLAIRPMGQRL